MAGHAEEGRERVLDDDLQEFIQGTLRSVWTLEVLLLLRRTRERDWSGDELVRELRASEVVVSENLGLLQAAGLVAPDAQGRWRYTPASPVFDALTRRLETVYREKPVSVVKAIVASPNEKLQTFADAFKLKGDRK